MRARTFYLALAILLGTSAGLHGEVLYTVTDLGTLGGATSSASGINNNGMIVGKSDTGALDAKGKAIAHAFLWSGGQIHDLGALPGDISSSAAAINDSGQIVGASSNGSRSHAYLYDHGTFTDLGTLGGTNSSAQAINSSGQIVGNSNWLQNGQSSTATHAFLFDHGTMTELITPDLNSSAQGINGIGQIVINSFAADGLGEGFIYQGGQFTGIFDSATVWAINASGQVTGLLATTSHPYILSGGVRTDLGSTGSPAAINSLGVVVGASLVTSSTASAFIYKNQEMLDLNTLVDPNSGWRLNLANGINDQGQIVGKGINPDGQTHAFLLNPVPEPAITGLIAATLPMLLMRPRPK